MRKRLYKIITVIIAAVTLLLSALSVRAAGSYFLSEGFSYGVKNGEAYVHSYVGDDWDIVIRDKFLSYSVTAVEERAFYENETMQALSFYDADELRSIGNRAFARCTALQYVNITSSIQEMGVGVFDGCTALYYARFRSGALREIPAQSFYGCTSLETVIFQNEPTSIGSLAFAYCEALKKIEIPSSVNYIADNAFVGCDELVIYCTKDSYALKYAVENGIDYVIIDEKSEGGYIIGDANGDGIVMVQDVTDIQKFLAGMTVADFNEAAADVDGNGISVSDATEIQRYIAEFENVYHINEAVNN